MSIAYNTSIVRNGLVLHLDAANRKSYPGSGTNWTDLSGNGNNGTLINGVAYSTDNNGIMSFDGTNDYVRVPHNPNLSFGSSSFTIDMFFNLNSLSNVPRFMQKGLVGNSNAEFLFIINSSGFFSFATNSTGTATFSTSPSDWSPALSTWHHAAIVKVGTTLSYYRNGEYFYQSTVDSTMFSGTSDLTIGSTITPGNFLNGKLPAIKMYNRALSAVEIQQNFNALRGRYGI